MLEVVEGEGRGREVNAGAVVVSQHQVSSLGRQDVFNSLEKEFHCRK